MLCVSASPAEGPEQAPFWECVRGWLCHRPEVLVAPSCNWQKSVLAVGGAWASWSFRAVPGMLPSCALLPPASFHWGLGTKPQVNIFPHRHPQLKTPYFFMSLSIPGPAHVDQPVPSEGPQFESCAHLRPRRGAGTTKRVWRGDCWPKTTVPSSSISGHQLRSVSLSSRAQQCQVLTGVMPCGSVTEKLFWHLLKWERSLYSRRLQ